MLAASACQVTVAAEIDAKADGTGVVRAGVGLDADALKAAPDLATQLRVDDLRQSGWTVTGPSSEGDGLTWVRASKPFSTPGQASAVMGELAGVDGPFRDLALRQSRTLLKSKTAFYGVADFSAGTSAFVDPDLRAKLGDDLKLDNQAFRFEVTARLPGETKMWSPPVGQRTVLQASAEGWRLVPVVPAAVALLCAAAAVVLVVRRRRA
ncbi:MAG TPA: hypothetical protein VF711_02705 [Acidimicrobiales bacterium]